MTKKSKIILISSISAGVLLATALVISLVSVNHTKKVDLEALYQKGVTHLVNGEYKSATFVFADSRLSGYKDTAKKYNYSFNLQKYEQHYYTYEQLIDSGLKAKGAVAVVDFITDGGTLIPRKTITERQDTPYITEKSHKQNYDFISWNLNLATYEQRTDSIRYILESVYNNHYFNITYDYDGGESESLAPSTYQYDKGDVHIPNAKKTGYIFNGYESNLYDEPTIDFVIPNGTAKDLDLTAKYTAKTVHIKFDASPISITTELDVTYGTDVRSTFPTPHRAYYHFDGWYYKDRLVNLESFDVDVDATLIAKYSAATYHITYVLNGGTPCGELPETYSGDEIVPLPYVERNDKIFIGWNDNHIGCKTKVNFTLPPTDPGDVTITAYFVDATIYNGDTLMDIADHTVSEILIPSYIKKIDPFLLSYLSNLEAIYVDSRNDTFTVENHVLVQDGHIAFGYPRGYLNTHTSVILPSNIDEIGDRAFRASSITQISGSHIVSTIREQAFYGCTDFVVCNLNNISRVEDKAFMNTKINNSFLAINKNSLNYIGEEAFASSSISSLDITSNVIHVGDSAFADCTSLTNVKFHPNLNSELGENIFSGCSNLREVETDLTFIGDLITKSLVGVGITDVKLTGSGTIAKNTFKDNTTIERVDLSDASIMRIKESAFEGCEKLESVNFETQGDLFSIEGNAFKGTAFISLDFTSNPHLRIEDHAFDSCSSLTSIKLLHGQVITRMGDVFSLCGNIQSIEYIIEETDDDIIIPGFMFANLNNVKTISIKYLGENNKEITFSNGAFKGDTNLIDVELDNCHVTSLPAYCFEGCTAFKNSNGAFSDLETYGEGAFFSCTQLDTMTLNGTVTIGNLAFGGCYSLCKNQTLTVTNTVATIGEEAFTDIVGVIHLDFTRAQVANLTQPGGAWDRFDAGFAGSFTYLD